MKENKTSPKYNDFVTEKRPSWVYFVLLVALLLVSTVCVTLTSRSDEFFLLGRAGIPYRAITGALSSIANICMVFLVLFYNKPGFVIAATVLIIQFPAIILDLFLGHNYSGIAGFFVDIFIFVAISLLYINNRNVKKYQLEKQEYMTTDRLTKLPNRLACYMYAEKLINRGEPFAIAVLNVNHFKHIKNSLGQHMGDATLAEVASRLKAAAEKNTAGGQVYLAYNGGDEFTFIISNYESDKLVAILEYYSAVMDKAITLSGVEYFLNVRIGYAEYPKNAEDLETVYTYALIAMTAAKKCADKNYICGFTSDLYSAEREMETERRIREAIKEWRLKFYLQPQYDTSHNLRGFEVLARIFNNDGTIFSPAEFIPTAEKSGLIDIIDYTVFKDAVLFLKELMARTDKNLIFCVNVSVRHLMKKTFLSEVKEVLENSGVPANRIEIEITESIMIDSIDEAINSINELKKLGMNVAIDDFGTGYSSLSYLNSFPSDIIKIDKSFIEKMALGDTHKQYVASIISIGHIMNFKVVAEGVETAEELEMLKSVGCDYIQGFYWGKPMPPEEAEKLI